MGFVDNLRMSSLFGGGGNPLGGTPVAPADDLVSEYATRILPLIHGEQNRQQTMNTILSNRIRAQKMEDEDNARQHPNVVFNPGINPLQKANLDLKQEAEQGKNDRAAASLNERQGYGASVIKIRQQANDIANFKATHPNVQITAQKGGNYLIYDPAHPELGMQDSGLDTNTSSDEEKAKLGFDNALKLINARGDQSRQSDAQRAGEATDLQKLKGSQSMNEIGARGDQSRLTDVAKPGSATDRKTEYSNRAQQLMNNPTYSKYITRGDKAGEFTIDPKAPQDIYHQINQSIYGYDTKAQPGQDVELPDDAPAAKDALGIR